MLNYWLSPDRYIFVIFKEDNEVNEVTQSAYVNLLRPPVGCNLPVSQLVEIALARGEGVLAASGSLSCTTGKYTGRSPQDRFIVDEPSVHDRIAWGKINRPIAEKSFEGLYQKDDGIFGHKTVFYIRWLCRGR